MTKRTTKVTILSALLAGGLSAGGWIAGCSTDPVESGPPSQNLGNVNIGLVVGVDVTLNTVTYTITGPAGYSRTGTIDVTNSSAVNAIISGIPFGTGYQIALKGTTTDGMGICMGSASFDVTSTTTVTVPVSITCNLQPQTGSIMVNGVLNACPRIDAVGASPANAAVGGTIALTATAVDVDHGPSPLSYQLDGQLRHHRQPGQRQRQLHLHEGRHGDGHPGGLRRRSGLRLAAVDRRRLHGAAGAIADQARHRAHRREPLVRPRVRHLRPEVGADDLQPPVEGDRQRRRHAGPELRALGPAAGRRRRPRSGSRPTARRRTRSCRRPAPRARRARSGRPRRRSRPSTRPPSRPTSSRPT